MDESTKEKIEGFTKVLRGLAKPAFDAFVWVLPKAISGIQTAHAYWNKLPQNAILFIYGTVFCFFGGTFPTLFAAIQAAEYGGRKTVMESIKMLTDEALVIIEESKKDDAEDKDGDGVKDVKQLSPSEFAKRKTLLVLRKMNPEKIDKAIASLYKVWMSVVAVLSIQFARTISMALAIADFLHKPCDRFVTPLLQRVIPDEYDKWVPVVLSWITKAIAMSLAWYIQTVQSAFASAMKGGLMMGRAAYQAMTYRGWTLGGLIPEDHSESLIDEVLQYGFAGLGFYTQFKLNFSVPFPLNLVLFPFQIAEQYIRYTITFGKGKVA
eukprot:CAMPEP_0168744724 /NCGR_PEP_ID=MMETSP0724-20121128/14242_1 /TAXON_ID=265536 /ORGANISM="Amphiprora sp., Strain CCMP467" /LENGTH=322 /DNA_ID=CAMNT_0008792399 /DNA_START=36 /DNA_END=1004 /DNA_ORIENTATION=-